MTASTQPHARGRMRRMLFAAVLLLCCTAAFSAATEHHCMFDRMAKKAGPPSAAMVLELPRQGRSGVSLITASEPESESESNWAPIRIKVFTEDMKDEKRYCTEVDQWRPAFNGRYLSCRLRDVMTEEKKKAIQEEIIPQATKLHADRLLVQPITGRIVVPNYTSTYCSQFTIPSSHHTEGVDGADMVMYAAAGPSSFKRTTWAIHCSLHPRIGRPIVGVMNLNVPHLRVKESFVRAAAHEIAHALGFYYEMFLQKGMVTRAENVRGKPRVLLVNSSKTLEKARAHYKCETAPGMELEDEGGVVTRGSHWEMRNAKDELMSGMAGMGVFGHYTTLTMAAFEDMGFYRANWSMAETMSWGRDSNCTLLESKCITNGSSVYPDMFCTTAAVVGNHMFCTSDRRSLGTCFTARYAAPVPGHFQYFTNSRRGAFGGFSDYCPVIQPTIFSRCIDAVQGRLIGSRVGPSSRCLKGIGLKYGDKDIGDVCAEVECDNKSHTVKVRYLDNDTWHECSEGEHIEPKVGFSSGKIMCPKYHEVCIKTGDDESEVDLSPMKVDSSDASAEEENGVLRPVDAWYQEKPKNEDVEIESALPGEKELHKQNEGAAVKMELNETGETSATVDTFTESLHSEGDTPSNLSSDALRMKIRTTGPDALNKDGGVSAGFPMPLFLLLTALSFVAL